MPTVDPDAAGTDGAALDAAGTDAAGPDAPAEPHRQRHLAESFGTDAARYDRARPGYPESLVERIVAASPGPDVLDVGCGTGIAARQFQAAGCRVLGVEVDPRMADRARAAGFEVDTAAFEDWEPAGRQFDAVVAGQAWHWVDPVVGAARAARVLRPGGRLAAFWNVFHPAPEVGAAFAAVHRRVLPEVGLNPWSTGSPAANSAFFTRPADGIRRSGAFGEPERWRFDWHRTYRRAEWLDQVPTHGLNTRLPPATLDELLAGYGAAIDAWGGRLTMQYAAVVVTARRAPVSGSCDRPAGPRPSS